MCLLLKQKMADAGFTPDQVHCGDVLISRKRAVNGNLYLLFARGQSRLCVFQNEWENFKSCTDDLSAGDPHKLSKKKL